VHRWEHCHFRRRRRSAHRFHHGTDRFGGFQHWCRPIGSLLRVPVVRRDNVPFPRHHAARDGHASLPSLFNVSLVRLGSCPQSNSNHQTEMSLPPPLRVVVLILLESTTTPRPMSAAQQDGSRRVGTGEPDWWDVPVRYWASLPHWPWRMYAVHAPPRSAGGLAEDCAPCWPGATRLAVQPIPSVNVAPQHGTNEPGAGVSGRPCG